MQMRKFMLFVVVAQIAALAAVPALASDDKNFTDLLKGPSSPHLGSINGDYGYTPAGLARSTSDAGYDGFSSIDRPMVKTLSGEFLNTDFVAELTVTRTVGDVGSTRDLIYFGFGQGVPNPSYYNEPTNSFVFRIHSSAGYYGVHAAANKGFAGNHFVHINTIGNYNPAGTTFRIEKSGDDVTLSIVGGGSVTYSVTALGGVLDGSNAYIFFGNSVLGTVFSDLSVQEVVTNTSPDVSGAAPSVASLWPPNNKMVDISILGVTDPDGDDVTIEITGITNNETGSADAGGVGTATAKVRAARNGKGNGRTYTISFTASDGQGGESQGTVEVSVPHDQGKNTSVAGSPSRSIENDVVMEANPTEYTLANAYPSPFNPSTTISYELPEPTRVQLSVFDKLGREVAVLVDGEKAAGRHAVRFNAEGLTSGIYVYRIHAGTFTQTRKFTLMK